MQMPRPAVWNGLSYLSNQIFLCFGAKRHEKVTTAAVILLMTPKKMWVVVDCQCKSMPRLCSATTEAAYPTEQINNVRLSALRLRYWSMVALEVHDVVCSRRGQPKCGLYGTALWMVGFLPLVPEERWTSGFVVRRVVFHAQRGLVDPRVSGRYEARAPALARQLFEIRIGAYGAHDVLCTRRGEGGLVEE